MNIVDKMKAIRDYYLSNIGVGHTTAMRKGTDVIPSIVVNLYHHPTSNTSLESLNNLRGQKLPLIIEHAALTQLLIDSIDNTERLENDILELRAHIDKLHGVYVGNDVNNS